MQGKPSPCFKNLLSNITIAVRFSLDTPHNARILTHSLTYVIESILWRAIKPPKGAPVWWPDAARFLQTYYCLLRAQQKLIFIRAASHTQQPGLCLRVTFPAMCTRRSKREINNNVIRGAAVAEKPYPLCYRHLAKAKEIRNLDDVILRR